MTCFMEVPGGVFILGRIAAANMPADQAEAQVNPGITGGQAFFTTLRMGLHFLDEVLMRAFFFQ